MLTVVTGPPCGGKSTYVRDRARPGDIVIDLDRIALAFSVEGTEHHTYPTYIKRLAQTARRSAVDEALTLCQDVDVWLIDTMPSPRAARRYTEADAVIVACDPGQPVVLSRIAAERPAEIRQVALDYYAGTLRSPRRGRARENATQLRW